MNKFNYYITTHFIHSNKDYNSCRNLYSMYQTYPKCANPLMSLMTIIDDQKISINFFLKKLINK